MMSQRSKREMIATIQPRYLKADKAGKAKILDEFIAVTGYHRKYAIRVLRHGSKPKGLKRAGRRKTYQGEVVQALEQIWEIYGRICSKRLQPFMAEGITVLERCHELTLPAGVKQQLMSMSRATIDRCLKKARFTQPQHGLSTTKPGSLLKAAIPIRTFTPWEDEHPGFLEIDLVAHCGPSTDGTYLNTLTATDLATGWTECLALADKTQSAVSQAIAEMRQDLPFALLGLDSDNGSEFINDTLYRYCLAEHITFTRSRPYQKNDQAHVEQKNWSVVRHTIGYDRLEGSEELAVLRSIYTDLRLYINFFQPVLKLVGKERIDGKTVRTYDQAKTPYRRVMTLDTLPVEVKARLTAQYVLLNPVRLRASIDAKVGRLWKIIR
ncbi:MAG: DDE-type integrase/transposase/recombinase [Patescibacteria group bacterium]|nr:DDE-type integrase/transposase/recombinase [Patescibacteria group bacterium]